MIVQIVGKSHRSGTSKKTGRDYDFTEIHFLCPSRNVEGQSCRTAIIGSEVCRTDSILINQHYELETDLDGNIIKVRPAKA